MKLSNLIAVIVVLVFAVLFFPVSCTRIDAGHVGIKINNAGSLRGIEKLPVLTGWVFYNRYTQRVVEFPANIQTTQWTKDIAEGKPVSEEMSFSDNQGTNLTGDFSMSYVMITDKIPAFYQLFRTDDMETFTHGYMKNVVRDQINEVSGHYAFEDISGSKKEQWIREIKSAIQKEVANIGVDVRQFGPIGNIRPPANLVVSINQKIEATQNAMKAELQLRQTKAEAAKRVAAAEGAKQSVILEAQGNAEANRLLTQSLTRDLIEWKRLEIERAAVDKWKGEVPTTQLGGGAAVPFFNVTPK